MSDKPKLLFTIPRPALRPTPKAIVIGQQPVKPYTGWQTTGVLVGGIALGVLLAGLILALVMRMS